MKVGVRGVVSSVVPSCAEQKCEHSEHRSYACRPNTTDIAPADYGADYAVKYEYNSNEKQCQQIPHVEEVVKILIRLQ